MPSLGTRVRFLIYVSRQPSHQRNGRVREVKALAAYRPHSLKEEELRFEPRPPWLQVLGFSALVTRKGDARAETKKRRKQEAGSTGQTREER